MKLTQTIVLSFCFVSLTYANTAQAWDLSSVRTWLSKVSDETAAKFAAASPNNSFRFKPEQSIFGPKTYFVGDQNITSTFQANTSSRYRFTSQSSGSVQVDYVLNGQKKHLVIANKADHHEETIQLDAQNTLQVIKVTGKTGQSVTFRISTTDIVLPPDPVAVAPTPNPSSAPDIGESTAFIYSGANPIQTGVAQGTIDTTRVAVLRGRVLDSDLAPLSGVLVTALNHPELGETLTRADGVFDFAANGGEEITLNFKKDGYLSSNRPLETTWRDFTDLTDDVVLIQRDSNVTKVTVNSSAPQIAKASTVSDQSGQRTAVLYVPPSTGATLKFEDGRTQSITSLSVAYMTKTHSSVTSVLANTILRPVSGCSAIQFYMESRFRGFIKTQSQM